MIRNAVSTNEIERAKQALQRIREIMRPGQPVNIGDAIDMMAEAYSIAGDALAALEPAPPPSWFEIIAMQCKVVE